MFNQKYGFWKTTSSGDHLHTVITCEDGLFVWGSNYYGQLGINNDNDTELPTKLTDDMFTNPQAIDYVHHSNDKTFVVMRNGEIYACGDNEWNALGGFDTDEMKVRAFLKLPYFTVGDNRCRIINICCGSRFSMFQATSGQLFSCGFNHNGQLGHGDYNPRRAPTLIQPEIFTKANVTCHSISCGEDHTLILNTNGYVYGWGDNTLYQVGASPENCDFTSPTYIHIPKGLTVIQLSCSLTSSFCVTSSRQMYSWGSNDHKQLGLIDLVKDTRTPSELSFTKDKLVFQLAVGMRHVLMLTNEGHLYGWGSNRSYQIMYKECPFTSPQLLDFFPNQRIVRIACRSRSSFVMLQSGEVYGWGDNTNLSLGITPQFATIKSPVYLKFFNEHRLMV